MQKCRDPGQTFFYCCFFVNNQYRILVEGDGDGSENLETLFESRLLSIGHVVALLDGWDLPRYLTRIWTIYEQFVATRLGIPMAMALPLSSSKSLMEEIEKG